MHIVDYSPFHFYNQQNTDKKQTTSYKKYPANKYISEEDPIQLKNKLFHQEKYSNQKKYSRENAASFFKNQKVRQFGNFNPGDSVIQNLNYFPRKNETFLDQSYELNQPCKVYPGPNFKQKKSRNQKKPHKQKLRSKSCQLQGRQTKKNFLPSKQERQELQMYKKLCVTLRKQNEDIKITMAKMQNQSSKFRHEIQSLKQKITKMYDYCIQKNKSSKNVDFTLQELIKKNTNKQNIKTNLMRKQDPLIDVKKLQKSNQLRQEQQKNHKICKIDKKTKRQTIDSVRTLVKDKNSSIFKGQGIFKKKPQKMNRIGQIQQKKSPASSRFTPNQTFKYPEKFLQYDEKESQTEPAEPQNSFSETNKYIEFFQTFIKSFQIFITNSLPEHKTKIKMLRDGGYDIQWAKQQWLEIVEFLIQKGYISGNSHNKKTKRYETTQRAIR